ncbi:MAG: malate synthase A, partial [Actinomycetota bacterium]|nr:malate synthase A [Actinomycetota bacterium]
GHDGTWVAHPDLVPLADEVFTEVLGERPHQIDRQRDEVAADADALLNVRVDGATITDRGVRMNVDVAIQYLASWLRGNGAAGIYNLMEDAATAEISRSQLWQWLHNDVTTVEGTAVTAATIHRIADEELARMKSEFGDEYYASGRFEEARRLLEEVAISDDFPEFLTLPAYELID